jgi:hypothetical protein
VPLRLVLDTWYPDVSLTTYVKVAALDGREEGCTAAVETLAAYLGMSRRSVERGLAPLHDDTAGRAPLVTTKRRTYRGGRGQSAQRRVVPVSGEFVLVPVAAADTLTPRQLRAYALLVYAERKGLEPTMKELAGYLRHQSGKRAGEPVGERTARHTVDALEAAMWLAVERRDGYQGRHRITVHRSPLRPVPTQAEETPSAVNGGGSGAVNGDASLAYKEDHLSPTDLRTPAAVACGSTEGAPRWTREAPVDNPADADAPTAEGGPGSALRAEPRKIIPAEPSTTPSALPPLTVSGRVAHVLAELQPLVARMTRWQQRETARAIGRTLDAEGNDPERLADRVRFRVASADLAIVRDPYAWTTRRALSRRGCANPDCESGWLWSTGEDCRLCATVLEERRAAARARRADQPAPGEERPLAVLPHPRPAVPWRRAMAECGDCQRPFPGRAPVGGLCRDCREEATA